MIRVIFGNEIGKINTLPKILETGWVYKVNLPDGTLRTLACGKKTKGIKTIHKVLQLLNYPNAVSIIYLRYPTYREYLQSVKFKKYEFLDEEFYFDCNDDALVLAENVFVKRVLKAFVEAYSRGTPTLPQEVIKTWLDIYEDYVNMDFTLISDDDAEEIFRGVMDETNELSSYLEPKARKRYNKVDRKCLNSKISTADYLFQITKIFVKAFEKDSFVDKVPSDR